MIACVSVDLDEAHHYHAIHGLPPPSGEAAHVAFRKGLPRLTEFFASLGIPFTLFVVTEDLEEPRARDAVGNARDAGGAIESHSAHHRYDLVRLSSREMESEIEESFVSIAKRFGERPQGFRAPGYNVSNAVLDALERSGATFDASVFPCLPYYLGKLAVLGAYALRGRASSSTLGDPRVMFAPIDPYRPSCDNAYRASTNSPARKLIEIPVPVTEFLRIPINGASLALVNSRVSLSTSKPLAQIALHAIDFVEKDEVAPELLRFVPELRVPLNVRLERLRGRIEACRQRGRRFATLREVAAFF
jgi:peptidoglycan-N-acetylglucosamine deacetylase